MVSRGAAIRMSDGGYRNAENIKSFHAESRSRGTDIGYRMADEASYQTDIGYRISDNGRSRLPIKCKNNVSREAAKLAKSKKITNSRLKRKGPKIKKGSCRAVMSEEGTKSSEEEKQKLSHAEPRSRGTDIGYRMAENISHAKTRRRGENTKRAGK